MDEEGARVETKNVEDPNCLLEIVVNVLDTEGHEAVQLRDVARRARVSLATIYKRHPTRDELIVAALEHWMQANRFARLRSIAATLSGESIYSDLLKVFRTIFAPWERHPLMLRAYVAARSGPGGHRLIDRGVSAVVPVARTILAGVDPDFARDLELVLNSVVLGFLGQFAHGEIEVTEIVPGIERALYWMAHAYENEAATTTPPQRRRRRTGR